MIYNLKHDKLDTRDIKLCKSIAPHSDVVLPQTVDLRLKCPPIYDQGTLGSCTANAGCTARIMRDDLNVSLSRLFLYYQERSIDGTIGEDAGASIRDICKVLKNSGVCEENYMPYEINKFAIAPSNDAITNAQKYTIQSYKSLNGIDEIKVNLALRQQPVLLGMQVYESFEGSETAKTGLLTLPRPHEKNCGGHAILIVGYYDNQSIVKNGHISKPVSKGYFVVRNSWGTKWGINGYFYMPYEYVEAELAFDFWTID